MTVGLSDLAHLPCDADLISAGIAFACQSQWRLFAMRSSVPVSRIRRNGADALASLALRHWLSSETVSHGLAPIAPLTEPHLRLITLGGRKLLLVNHLISNRDHIQRLRRNPRLLLQTPIPVSSVQAASERLSPGDLLAFCILMASACHGAAGALLKADSTGMAFFLAVPPLRGWRQQRPWRPLGRLTIAGSGDEPIELEVCGLLADRSLSIERATIASDRPLEMTTPWHNLLYVRSVRMPPPALRVACPGQGLEWTVTPSSWSNLWFYNPHLVLVGWLTLRELEVTARTGAAAPQARGVHPLSHAEAVLVQAMRPMHELLQIARHM